jgi:histidine ammonia-lyase
MAGEPDHVVLLKGEGLTYDQVTRIARGDPETGLFPRVELHPDRIEVMQEMRDGIEAKIEAGEIMYGVNTGCGSRRNQAIKGEDLLRYQFKYAGAHSCGEGAHLPIEVVRAMLALRVNSFAVGNSGITLALCNCMLDMLNKNVIPVVPEFGSVGASGDLIPLAHIGSVIFGFEDENVEVFDNGHRCHARDAFRKHGIKHHELQAKEAMGLTNGATMILAIACLALTDIYELILLGDLALALHLEAIRGELNAFDRRIHDARNQHGQMACAERIRIMTRGSLRCTAGAQAIVFPHENVKRGEDGERVPRVQDEYSIRCTPQSHGAILDAWYYLRKIVSREINASTDNPLIFADGNGGFDVLSGGNFHGDTLCIPIDAMKVGLAKLARISDRRFYHLLDPAFSHGLPSDLAGNDEDDNSGLMIAQYATAAAAMRTSMLAIPGGIFNIPTSAGQEDYISNGANAAWMMRKALGALRTILGWEIIAGCQAISLGIPHLDHLGKLGEGTQLAFEFVREHIDRMDGDRYLYADIEAMRPLIVDHSLGQMIFSFVQPLREPHD